MKKHAWREFDAARAFARGLGLVDQTEWLAYCRGDLEGLLGRRPEDVPSNPHRTYRGRGWRGMADWLEPPLDPVEPGYLGLKAARRFSRSLGLRTSREWRAWCRGRRPDLTPRPGNVPAEPARVYPRAWRGWADWLGTERRLPKSRRHLPFDRARACVRALGLPDVKAWRAWCKGHWPPGESGGEGRPPDIPANPDGVYRHSGWAGYGDWLGTQRESVRDTPHMPFEEARAFVRGLGLATEADYLAWIAGQRPSLPAPPVNLTTNPHRTYRHDGWESWGDFLGTGRVANYDKRFRPFEAARDHARSLGLRSAAEWQRYWRGERPDLGAPPDDLPSNPNVSYRDAGWRGWGDFLGTGTVAFRDRAYRAFPAARHFVHGLGLPSSTQWRAYVTGKRPDLPPLPDDLPAAPEYLYRERGWTHWGDFLGSGRPPRRRRAVGPHA